MKHSHLDYINSNLSGKNIIHNSQNIAIEELKLAVKVKFIKLNRLKRNLNIFKIIEKFIINRLSWRGWRGRDI